MNLVHEYAPFATMLLAIVVGILFNRHDYKSLREDLKEEIGKIDRRLSIIEGDLRNFYSITGEHKGRLDTMEKWRT